MSVQNVETLLQEFDRKAAEVRNRLVDLLGTVYKGCIPSESLVSGFTEELGRLKAVYERVYASVCEIAGPEADVRPGQPIEVYADVLQKSEARLLHLQTERAKAVLASFVAIQTDLDVYRQALEPFRQAAAQLLSRLDVSTIREILPETEYPALFLEAVRHDSLTADADGVALLEQLGKHYPLTVCLGLSAHLYRQGDCTEDMSGLSPTDKSAAIGDRKTAAPVSEAGVCETDNESPAEVCRAESAAEAVAEAPIPVSEHEADVSSEDTASEAEADAGSADAVSEPEAGVCSAEEVSESESGKVSPAEESVPKLLPAETVTECSENSSEPLNVPETEASASAPASVPTAAEGAPSQTSGSSAVSFEVLLRQSETKPTSSVGGRKSFEKRGRKRTFDLPKSSTADLGNTVLGSDFHFPDDVGPDVGEPAPATDVDASVPVDEDTAGAVARDVSASAEDVSAGTAVCDASDPPAEVPAASVELLYPVNRPKTGKRGTTAFKADIHRQAKAFHGVSMLLVLFSWFGALTAEQCFRFAPCVGGSAYGDARKKLECALRVLADRGYLAEFVGVDGDAPVYCLTDYSMSCLGKENVSNGLRTIDTLLRCTKLGKHAISCEQGVDAVVLRRTLKTNELLLQYAMQVYEQGGAEATRDIFGPLRWRNGGYSVGVRENEQKTVARLVGAGENVAALDCNALLVCDPEAAAQVSAGCLAGHVFLFEAGKGLRRLKGKPSRTDVSDADRDVPSAAASGDTPEVLPPADGQEASEETSTASDVSPDNVSEGNASGTAEEEGIQASEAGAASENKSADPDDEGRDKVTVDWSVFDRQVGGEPADREPADGPADDSPEGMVRRAGRPSDAEFCTLIHDLVRREALSYEQLRTVITDAVLLAYGAGLNPEKAPQAEQLSQQLRLATHLLPETVRYDVDSLTRAFPEVTPETEPIALAAYMFAMLSPEQVYDFSLSGLLKSVFQRYEELFPDWPEFKQLFGQLSNIGSISKNGFTPVAVAMLGNETEQEKFLGHLRIKAEQFLNSPKPNITVRLLPLLYGRLFDMGSQLRGSLQFVAQNSREDWAVSSELVAECLNRFCDVREGTYSFSRQKVDAYIDEISRELIVERNLAGHRFRLDYEARRQLISQIRMRLDVLVPWLEHVRRSLDDGGELKKLRSCRDALLKQIDGLIPQADRRMDSGVNVLRWALRMMREMLTGTVSPIKLYADLLYTGVFSLSDDGIPQIDATMDRVSYYEPWRNALRHMLAPRRPAEEVKKELRGETFFESDEREDAGLHDNLQQLRMLCRLTEDNSSEEPRREEAEPAADRYMKRFTEALELAYSYNRINETEKETLLGICNQYKERFYQMGDFACWRRFLDALKRKIRECSVIRKYELMTQLKQRQASQPESPLLREAVRLLSEEDNFAVAEEFVTRFDGGETELPTNTSEVFRDRDYLADFLDKNAELYRFCYDHRGDSLSSFGEKYLKMHWPQDWTEANRNSSLKLLSNWPDPNSSPAKACKKLESLFGLLGFSVKRIEAVLLSKTNAGPAHRFHAEFCASDRSQTDYSHPIAKFGTRMPAVIDVVLFDASKTEQQLVDVITKQLDIEGPAIVILCGQAVPEGYRRKIGEIFHIETSCEKWFLTIDQALFLYLALHQETERMPALLKCTLPFTDCQPFDEGNGGTSIADEMFFGRKRELDSLINPNGACFMYGGRQLGKTSLLERVVSRCQKPEKKSYAVLVSVHRLLGETAVVGALRQGIRKMLGEHLLTDNCTTFRELCDSLNRFIRDTKAERFYLLIDEADSFLESIAESSYQQIQPLVELRRETQNRFKFILAGLHNVCRAKNAIRENGILGQFSAPLCIKPLSPAEALQLFVRPLRYLGFRFDDNQRALLETILANTNCYPGVLQAFGYALVANLKTDYGDYYHASDGNPPFVLKEKQLAAVINSRNLIPWMQDRINMTLELDPRYKLLARCITMRYHLDGNSPDSNGWIGFSVDKIREVAEMYGIKLLTDETADSLVLLLDELVDMGILCKTEEERYRLRRRSFIDIFGRDPAKLDEILSNSNAGGENV